MSQPDAPAKVLLVAFRGQVLCFAHVLLNALDMHAKGLAVKVILEGEAAGLPATYEDESTPFHRQYREAISAGLIDAVCQACATKMHGLEAARRQGLPIRGEMTGHPALAGYLQKGWQVLTF